MPKSARTNQEIELLSLLFPEFADVSVLESVRRMGAMNTCKKKEVVDAYNKLYDRTVLMVKAFRTELGKLPPSEANAYGELLRQLSSSSLASG